MLFSHSCKLLQIHSNINRILKMPVFRQKLNPIFGESTWDSEDEDYDYQQEIARSSFADMLHDKERNMKYYEALKLAIEKMHSMGKKAKVLDIGTGTGLLSMMAVQCGADSVIACEAFAPMGDCANNIIKLNNCEGKIKIVPKHSTALSVGENSDLPERANILVTEVFDTELIGEGALATFSHAHQELLEKDCIVVPNSATVYAQVVETPLTEYWNKFKDIRNWKGDILIRCPDSIKNCSGAAAVHDIQLSQLPVNNFNEIFAPTPVVRFDWSGKTPVIFKRHESTKVKANCNGTAQVVFMWWELEMDTDNQIILSCAPYWAHPLKKDNRDLTSSDIPWRDHWMQGVYYLPKEVSVKKDQELQLISSHDKYSWWFNVQHPGNVVPPLINPLCECKLHIAHSRTRIGQMNDEERNKKYLKVLNKYVNHQSVVLLLGDGFYLGLAAAKLGAKQILYMNDHHLSTKLFEDFMKFNDIKNVDIVRNNEALVANQYFKHIDLIIGQPHFTTTILPWDGLHFAYLVKKIRSSLQPHITIAPQSATIKGILVEFKDLQKIRLPVEVYEGFDMKPFDNLMMSSTTRCDANVEAQPLWEYPGIAKSPVVELAKLNLETMFTSKHINTTTPFPIYEKIRYNAVALWVEWDLDGSGENIISTGPIAPPVLGQPIHWDMHTRQGVHFLCDKLRESLQVKFQLNVEEGSIKFSFD